MTIKIPTNEDFIAGADLHIHSKVPENRKGDYFGQVIMKFSHLLAYTIRFSAPGLLVVAGDFFDAPNVPYKVTKRVIELIKESGIEVLVVPGQHDLRYHVSGLDNTPLGTLEAAGVVSILSNTCRYAPKGMNGVTFIGSGWNEEPQEEADVLVMHRMITKKGELWPGQKNYSTAHAILRKYPWAKCIISGDNHTPHSLRTDGKLQINCGSMVRSTKSQIGYQPRCWRVDTSTWKAKPIKIQCLSDEEVFDFGKIAIEEIKEESKKEAEKKIAEFIDTLPKNSKERPDFKNILNNVVAHVDPKQSVRDIIDNTMERVGTANEKV